MNFSFVCFIGLITAIPFGIAFVLTPDQASALFGIAGWNPGTTSIARLFGAEILYMAAAIFAVQGTTDLRLQHRFALAFSMASAVATLLAIYAVLSGAANALAWSVVLIYGFFTLAWGAIALRRD